MACWKDKKWQTMRTWFAAAELVEAIVEDIAAAVGVHEAYNQS